MVALIMQLNFEEAIKISLEAENNFLALYREAPSEDQKITINETRYMVGFFQTYILLYTMDYLRALYSRERYRMLTLRKEIQMLPLIDADNIINDFQSQMFRYCKENSSILVYLSDSYSAEVHCWIVNRDQLGYYYLFMKEESNSEFTHALSQCSLPILSMPMCANLDRSFPVNSESGSNSEKLQRFVNMTCKRLWTYICPKILSNNIPSICKRLVFISDNRLNLIPYATLGNNTGMPSKSVSDYPLLKNFTISQSPSFWALSSTWMRSSNDSSHNSIQPEKNLLALIIGNPENNLPAAED